MRETEKEIATFLRYCSTKSYDQSVTFNLNCTAQPCKKNTYDSTVSIYYSTSSLLKINGFATSKQFHRRNYIAETHTLKAVLFCRHIQIRPFFSRLQYENLTQYFKEERPQELSNRQKSCDNSTIHAKKVRSSGDGGGFLNPGDN